jgi:hypothetical protein
MTVRSASSDHRATGDYSSIAAYSSALISKLASEGSDSFTFTSQPCP